MQGLYVIRARAVSYQVAYSTEHAVVRALQEPFYI
jgi:hypothetical protein